MVGDAAVSAAPPQTSEAYAQLGADGPLPCAAHRFKKMVRSRRSVFWGGLLVLFLVLLRGHNGRRLQAVRCVSAGAERREGVLCVAPAYVVSPQAKKKERKEAMRLLSYSGCNLGYLVTVAVT
jgi:hypothetical protein